MASRAERKRRLRAEQAAAADTVQRLRRFRFKDITFGCDLAIDIAPLVIRDVVPMPMHFTILKHRDQ